MTAYIIALALALSVHAQAGKEPGFAGDDRPGPTETREVPVVSAGEQLLPAPAFALSDLGGERIRLEEIDAPVIILHFWTKSRQCEDDLKLLQKLHEKYKDKGVAILGLAWNSGPSRDEVRTYTQSLGLTFPTLMCSYATAQAYDVATYPTTYALNHQKNIRYWMYGILVPQHWDNLIAEMLLVNEAE